MNDPRIDPAEGALGIMLGARPDGRVIVEVHTPDGVYVFTPEAAGAAGEALVTLAEVAAQLEGRRRAGAN